jgi:hypothetical protein
LLAFAVSFSRRIRAVVEDSWMLRSYGVHISEM